MPRPSNFTERQKAEIYARGKATCAYTGANLWILDHGAAPYWDVDWAEHVVPVSRGGSSTLDNGVCVGSWENHARGNSAEAPSCLVRAGKMTRHAGPLPARERRAIEQQLARRLHFADWYFNRALARFMWGVAWLHDGVGVRTRDDRYYARAALKAIGTWRKVAAREGVPSLESRGLAPSRPSVGVRLLLSLRTASTVEEIRALMRKVLPAYAAKLKE